MGRITIAATFGLAMFFEVMARGQSTASKPAIANDVAAPFAAPRDVALETAEALVGRALFLRGFFAADDLAFDSTGRVQGTPPPEAWTLAGIDVQKAERRGPKEILLEGVRVAIRYNQDNHQFERHPQNDEKVRLRMADAADRRGTEAAWAAIFAQGIDPLLQRSTPPYWQHFFNPALEWLPNSPDSLAGQTIYATNGLPNPAKDVTPPSLAHRVDLKMPSAAVKDKIRGTVQLRFVVDAEGIPRRIAVVRPLGYGVEERAVDAVARWRFTPAMREGRPVAAALLLNLDVQFDTVPR